MANERRQQVFPRTVREVATQVAPWAGVAAALLAIHWALVVLADIPVLRLTENARTVYVRFGDKHPLDGIYSVLTLVLTAVGVGACVLTAMLPHLRRDDRRFATAIGIQFTLWGVEESLQLHDLLGRLLGGDRAGQLGALVLHAVVAAAILWRWPDRVVRVWPLIAVTAGCLAGALALDAVGSGTGRAQHLEEWLEIVGAVFLAGVALSLSRQAIVDATRSRRFHQPVPPIAPSGRVGT